MRLVAVWQQIVYLGDRVWAWLTYEASLHPFIFLGAVIVIVGAWVLYKAEVRTK